jgi:hypothetical protein
MKIQAVPASDEIEALGASSNVVMVKVSGPVDTSNTVLQRARSLVLESGSQAMIESFDWAVKSGAFVSAD